MFIQTVEKEVINVSRFSGKCDFYDSFVAIWSDGDEEKLKEKLKGLKLYVYGKDGRSHRVKSDTIKDIAKYYPYLEGICCASKQDDSFTVYLSSDSFIDQEEKEHISWDVERVLKYWRKCKRKKLPFDEEECFKKEFAWRHGREDNLHEIIHRIAENGDKAEFDDIHDNLHEYFRRQWFEELVRVGWTEREAYDWAFNAFFEGANKVKERLGRELKDE